MDAPQSNNYRFKCEVVEVIYQGEQPVVKMIGNPGSLILELPFKGHFKLGDRLIITGQLSITSFEKDCDNDHDQIARN